MDSLTSSLHTEAALSLPLSQFPPNVKYVIAFDRTGNSIDTVDGESQLDSFFNEFLIVIDGDPAEWHRENMRNRPFDYPSVLRANKRTLESLCKYVNHIRLNDSMLSLNVYGSTIRLMRGACSVMTEKDLIETLKNGSDFLLCQKLARPGVLLYPNESSCVTIGASNNNGFKELKNALLSNIDNSIKSSLLLMPETFPFISLLRLVTSLSGEGDSSVYRSEKRQQNMEGGFLSLASTCEAQLSSISDQWTRLLTPSDEEILGGRYKPHIFSETEGQDVEETGDNKGGAFNVKFVDPGSRQLLVEILNKTKEEDVKLLKNKLEANWTSAMNDGSIKPRMKASAEHKEAQRILNDPTKFLIRQSYSSEAHCSLFNSLPDSTRGTAIGVSADKRLRNILSPFSLLDSARHREVLGGPLPWEPVCLRGAITKLTRASIRKNLMQGLLIGSNPRKLYLRIV